ncbi:PAS domain S-box protein [Sphingomonas sp. HDW15A]|uniref:PAS domain S-box protein n=1 Tax=Sphingomonas sp. HDW15A TaxID=2714942 RepID=UPI00140D8E57|nr:PAS domain S-box protein [Sphingomonas sp. HDW15A]QIK95134.1 PAS domain S-box protein [Sphingomonas sp. HDW15A]
MWITEQVRGMVESVKEGSGSKRRERNEVGRFDFTQTLAIADALPMGIAYVDREHRYRFLNKSLADFFERPRAEILGKTMEEILGEEAMRIREPMLAAALSGERQYFVADYEHPSRGPLTVQADYLPQVDSEGRIAGVVIIVNDVTEQRLAERALKESEARFRRIADSAPAMMWVTRLDRTRDFVNDAYVEFTGNSREEARVLDWRSRIHPEDVDRIVEESIAGEAGGKPFTLEGRYRRHDGEYRWLRSVSQPRFGPDGELVGFIGVATDITLAKEAEIELTRQVEERTAALAASEARVRGLFDSALEMIGLLDLDGSYVEINRSARESLGLDLDAVRGLKPWEIEPFRDHPESQEKLRAMVAEAARGETVTQEMSIETVSGQATLIVSMQPVAGPDGKPMFLLGEARDISELKTAQEQLRQSQKMEALGQLTGGIAHDFNNLLTVVVGGLDLIVRRVTDDKLKRYAENALSAAERGARLTAQLLAFSRVQRLEVRPIEVESLIEGMRPLLRNLLGPEIRKSFKLNAGLVPVMADPTQLELVVLNLAINARDAMPDGGTITIATRLATIRDDSELEDGEYVELCVSDDGEGMPEDVVARAFEPFFTTKEVGKGTGLGLSMVYGVARQSGGTARIVSEIGQGTTVHLYFRQAESADLDQSTGGARKRLGKPRNASILVIDDDPDVREFVVGSLADMGYSVREAGDGPSGIEAFTGEHPDLVILDYAMPGMTGGEVAAHILAERPGQPILFISGYSESDAIQRAAPDAQVLAKPFRPDSLDSAIREALGKGKKLAV